MRGRISGFRDAPVTEITGQDFAEHFRKMISGEIKVKRFSQKDKQRLKVFLKEHGIEPYNWDVKK